MSRMRTTWSWLWKITAAGLAHTVGTALGSVLIALLTLETPRAPVEIDPVRQWSLAFFGGMVIAAGLTVLAVGLRGRLWQRWAILGTFAFVVNGVSIGLETWIFTTLGGDVAMALGTLPASVLCALAVSWLFPAPDDESLGDRLRHFRSHWSAAALAGRIVLVILTFPVFYLMFGAMVAPIVNPYYAQIDFLVIPPFTTIIGTQLLRSTLFLLVSLPFVFGWRGSRVRFALSLALGHVTAVGLSGLIQTPLFPPPMALAHAFEIFCDSVTYAWALAWLLYPATTRTTDQPRALGRRSIEFARWLRVLAALLCLVAIASWPYLYYQILKWFVCTASGIGAGIAYRLNLPAWTLALITVAIFFNPLFPMPLSQNLWMAADVIAGLTLLASFTMPGIKR